MAPTNNLLAMTQAERDEYFRRKLIHSGFFFTTYYTTSREHVSKVFNLPFGFGVSFRAWRWPWMCANKNSIWSDRGQRYGWFVDRKVHHMGRFGGGCNWSLGARFNSGVNMDLLFGGLAINFYNLNGMKP